MCYSTSMPLAENNINFITHYCTNPANAIITINYIKIILWCIWNIE